jgi:hypothetical protein
MTSVGKPYFDKRARVDTSGKAEKPWIVVIRTGRTGALIEHKRFTTEDQALAFAHYQAMVTDPKEES